MTCEKDGSWSYEASDCLNLSYNSAGVAKGDFADYRSSFCPQVAITDPAVAQEMAESAPEHVLKVIVKVFCRRFAKPSSLCDGL
jgi:hypothetical protein